MKTSDAFLLLAIFAFNTIRYTEQSSWNYVVYPNGTVEIIDLSQSPEDSASTLSELKEEVTFNLYTNSNPETEEELYLLDTSTLSKSNFNASNPTRFVVHGWQNSKADQVCTSIRDAYLAVGDYNVIVVDWSAHALSDYVTARTKIVTIGEYIGLMIDFLEAMGSSVEDMIIAGHSLGAHISGVAGRSASNTVGAVVGMDPAGPLFYMVDTFARLKPTDAEFVEVIHTSAGRLGYNGELGDVDYWPNGGWFQRGCGLDIFAMCAHSRSYLYFAESIIQSNNTYTSYACESYSEYEAEACNSASSSIMGGSTLDKTVNGTFYLTTNSAAPFARG
ncbi:pancreatic triacylglycerol lipase-like [Neodiprion pinetum]|uniref:pancreatic triacylglycerol lipase-like n=1 Tax=Neodiprion pinetum TaxID=441929 RepID=UPI001EE03934|nr:pancreatic triacylglycerol lipase-like [Neodiprion pinetum]